MARKPQRIIKATLIEGIGPITARDLLAMPEDSWGLLRGRITDRRHGKDGLVARCMACEGEVYIRTARLGERAVRCSPTTAEGIPTVPGIMGAMPCLTTRVLRSIRGARNQLFTV
jgi:hypothetical protein